jgi:RHS repeat-associated protein
MSYSYDNVGNTLSVTDRINGTVDNTTSHQFDALNRMTINSQGNKRVDYVYNAISQVTNKKRYSDSTGTNLVAETNHTYDSLNRLTNITHSKGANTIASYTQSYDAGSKITGITSTDGNSTFNYDDTDQLVGADYNYQTDENYTYDANGNRTNTGYVTGINNQLLEDSKYRYEYDKVGNRTKRTDKSTNEVTEYSWDIRDRLTGIRVINALGEVIRTANYVYDVYDQRIAKIVDLDGAGSGAATTERFVYGSNQNIALVFDGNGTLTNRYMFGNGVDQIEADEQLATGTTLWALTDHLGSVRDVVDNSGIVKNHIVYDAFGNVISQSNSSVIFRNTYTGQEFDSESGLFSYGGRYYDPFNGKFIQEDKIGFSGGDTNLNRYVFNQPITRTDPSGFESRELSALFKNSSFGRINTSLIYNTQFQNISEAYAYGAAWFDAITISGPVGLPQNNKTGNVVFRPLKDDTGLIPARAGQGTIRPFSKTGTKLPSVTIDLSQDDDLKRTHMTSGYLNVNEVKFSYKDKDKDEKDCTYFSKNVKEDDERQKARIAVGNIIAAYPRVQRTPSPQPQEKPNYNTPQFTPPNIDSGEFVKGILGMFGNALREYIQR